jgi:uncharacterized phage infection (PIP) family protein YhgE
MRLKDYMNEEIDTKKKKVRNNLKKQLQKLDSDIDSLMDNIEKEIDTIDELPIFKQKISQMLSNTEKECGEFLIAIRQLISTLGRNEYVIPQVRGHAKGIIPDKIDKEESKDTKEKEEN